MHVAGAEKVPGIVNGIRLHPMLPPMPSQVHGVGPLVRAGGHMEFAPVIGGKHRESVGGFGEAMGRDDGAVGD